MQNEPPAVDAGGAHSLIVALRAAFSRHRDAVLQAPTGAGKSTLVPLALLHERFAHGRKILTRAYRALRASKWSPKGC